MLVFNFQRSAPETSTWIETHQRPERETNKVLWCFRCSRSGSKEGRRMRRGSQVLLSQLWCFYTRLSRSLSKHTFAWICFGIVWLLDVSLKISARKYAVYTGCHIRLSIYHRKHTHTRDVCARVLVDICRSLFFGSMCQAKHLEWHDSYLDIHWKCLRAKYTRYIMQHSTINT